MQMKPEDLHNIQQVIAWVGIEAHFGGRVGCVELARKVATEVEASVESLRPVANSVPGKEVESRVR